MFTANALFTDDARRNPFALYHQIRSVAPVFHEPASDIWLIFNDPPRHSKLRALVSQAFTPRSIANLESRIRDLSRELLNASIENEPAWR